MSIYFGPDHEDRVTDDDLLQSLIDQMKAHVVIHGAAPLDNRQAEAVAMFMMPVITTEEYLKARKFLNMGKNGTGPCLHEDMAEILTKLLDNEPARLEEFP